MQEADRDSLSASSRTTAQTSQSLPGTAGQDASSDEFGTPDNDYLALAVSADMERIENRDKDGVLHRHFSGLRSQDAYD